MVHRRSLADTLLPSSFDAASDSSSHPFHGHLDQWYPKKHWFVPEFSATMVCPSPVFSPGLESEEHAPVVGGQDEAGPAG